jgi:hypothetical protein
MRSYFVFLSMAAAAWCQPSNFRPPAVPLVTIDPYFSVWSLADRLNEDATRHWTGTPQSLTSLIRLDGKAYRLMGVGRGDVPPLPQQRVQVLPTRTIYEFEGEGVHVTLTFLTAALPNDLELLSRPITYVSWALSSTGGHAHQAQLYFDAAAELAVNTPDQPVDWARFKLPNLRVLRAGTRQQPVLEKWGDNLRIDWGYLYAAAPSQPGLSEAAVDRQASIEAFLKRGKAPDSDDLSPWNALARRNQVLAYVFDLGEVSSNPVTRHIVLAYDDIVSLEYFHRRVQPYWRRNGAQAGDLLAAAEQDYPAVAEKCRLFDEELTTDLRRAGGESYAAMCSLAYRQSLAAHKLAVDADGTLLYFPKENFSNGCIETVDVFYPSSPLFLLMNPKLLRGSVEPILQYASMQRWPFRFAPHDLGTYPLANGQVYGGGEKNEVDQMPVEESGNLLILVAALAHIEGTPDLAQKYWPVLTKWAEYLRDKGLDPENQLCTDDFAGHLARNANLSLKAIEALGGYAQLCELTGRRADALRYRSIAQDGAKRWMQMAVDGDHTVLAFGKPGTWSQKYNLVWDRVLGLNLFPPELAHSEIAYYLTKQNQYGLPLDNRAEYTKLDWLFWTATLADSGADFRSLIAPAWRWAQETSSRVPMTDWYMTTDGKQKGFQARSVVGGLFMKMIADPDLWKKWAARAK